MQDAADNMALDAVESRSWHEPQAQQCVCSGSHSLSSAPAVLMPFVAERIQGVGKVEIDASWQLQTVPQGPAMHLCQSLVCGECGLLFLDKRFSDGEMARLYGGYRGEAYTAQREHHEPGYRLRNEALAAGTSHIPEVESYLVSQLGRLPVSVLDWGGDTGRNTPFRGKVEDVRIYDISGQDVLPGCRRIGRDEALGGQHELVVLSQVLEHLPYPGRELKKLRECLGPDSRLYVELPLETLMRGPQDQRVAPQSKRHWHEHINFFSAMSLRRLMTRCGLEVLDLRPATLTVEGKEVWIWQLLAKLA